MSFTLDINSYQQIINAHLEQKLKQLKAVPKRLQDAMHYSVLNGGKRVRGLLVIAAGLSFGANIAALIHPAIAVEFIHAYSLIHDDLPAMDNAELRRGIATCHIAFDEATAILAGDALLPLAFQCITEIEPSICHAEQKVLILHALAHSCGADGMVAGQMRDLYSSEQLSLDELNQINQQKTGALIQASIEIGALVANYDKKNYETVLNDFGKALGVAFQIQDDILDITQDTNTLGKMNGQDAKLHKKTFPHLMGLEKAIVHVNELYAVALDKCQDLPNQALPLKYMTEWMLQREK